jgi:hypothetical protein
MKLLIKQFLPASCHFHSFIGSNIPLCTLFLNTLSLFLLIRDQISHPYKTTSKILLFCILIFAFRTPQEAKDYNLNGCKHSTNYKERGKKKKTEEGTCRFQRVVMIILYNTEIHWFFGLCPVTNILNNTMSKTAPVSVLGWKGGEGALERANLNHISWGCTYSVESTRKG